MPQLPAPRTRRVKNAKLPSLSDIIEDVAKGKNKVINSLTLPQLSEYVRALEGLAAGLGGANVPDNPADFALKYSGGTWKEAPHLRLISDALARLERREIRFLTVSLPPRHGKSFLIDIWTPTWWLARHARDRIILSGYGETFARDWGAKVRDKIIEHADSLNLVMSKDKLAADDWELTTSGGMVCTGVGGALVGRGADLFIIDDPIKNDQEANSLVYRDHMWDWFQASAFTRLQPNGVMVVVACLAGDTPVLRADGTETPIRDIRPGDEVATYENGRITTAIVKNWANQGPDFVFAVRMKSGRVVRANARHPFRVIQANGEAIWVRLESLSVGTQVRCVEEPAISSSLVLTQCPSCEQPSNTWSIGADEIVEITEVGVEEVFDIEVERTHNFIAGGLEVSNTRWHEDDLIGRIRISEMKDRWVNISIPALAEKDDLLGRAIDAPLWPEHFTDDPDYSIRRSSMSPYWWAAQYQQRPTPEGGGIIREEWFQFYSQEDHDQIVKEADQLIQTWDPALLDRSTSDYWAGFVLARKGADIYVLAGSRGHYNLAQATGIIRQWSMKYPKALAKLIENTSMGPAVKQTLQHEVPGIIPVAAKGTKRSRIEAAIPSLMAGNVHLPQHQNGTKPQWVWDLISEACAFDKGANDDQIDSLAQGINFLSPGGWRAAKAAAQASPPELTPREILTKRFDQYKEKVLTNATRRFSGLSGRARNLW